MTDPITNSGVANLVDRILNFILNPITVRITVVRKCNENVENLKNQVEKLKDEKTRLENYKKKVGRRGEVIDDSVQTWLTKAEEFIKAAEEPLRVGDEFAKECFFRLCPNPIPRYKLSKEVERNSQDIVQHLEVARGFGPLLLSHAPTRQQDVASVSYASPTQQDVAALVEGFEEFRSRMDVLKQIMEALRNPIVNKIGVYGTSGVGKTMLVKMVKGKAKQDSLFTVVVMATVTKDRDLKSIQEDIARDLGMDRLSFREDTDRQVADLIKAKLMEERKFLVILDDVWDTEIDFEKFGIPSASEMKQATEKKNEESSSGQGDMLCKILLTSRFHDVLSSIIDEKDQVFEVNKLEDDEPWHLFKKIVGSNVESSNFQPTARKIVEQCLGLPVAIVSVGKAMKGKTQQFEWEDALTELKKPSPDGISAAVYKPIELSYKYLQDELKLTFMLCSLLGHDSSINDLLKCGMGLNLFGKVKTMEQTRARVLRLVHRLKQSSLLVEGHSNMHFGMHDQIREVALSIASREHGVWALADEDARQGWPEKETMENLKWICLSNGYPEITSNGLKCPRLTFFHLSSKGCSLVIPMDLFTGTEGLKVLCLTKIDFQSMTSQIPLIPTKLRTLLLDQCVFRVEELGAIMGNLENLEVLSLAGCEIEELPREMEKLTKLKLLDVSDCTQLKVIPRQVLARLSKLEELKMGNSFDQWDDVEGGNARLAELTELRMLTALEVRIPNFQETLFLENLERFKIFIEIGIVSKPWDPWHPRRPRHECSWDSYSWNSSFENSKIMKLKLQGASIKSIDSVKKLLKKTEELYLEGLNGIESLVDGLDDEGFQHLKCFHVQNSPGIRCVFNPAGRLLLSQVFPILEVLTLFNLEKMEKICHGLTGAAPFKVLRKITVVACHQLKNLFSFSVAVQLQLQEITVESCSNIEEIIIDDVEEQGNGNDIVEESEGWKLGNSLRSLKLEYLSKLISFNGSNCSNISLFNDKVVFPNLEKLSLSWIKINQLWITSSYAVTSQESLNFRKLKSLRIYVCSSLEYLFTPSMVSSLVQLENLYVFSCQDLKQVIMAKGVEEVVNTELIFPRLNSISLRWCNKLSSFYAGSYALKFQSAIKIRIEKCLNMITFASTFSTEQEKETTYGGTEGRLGKKEPDIRSQTFFYDAVDIPLLYDLDLSSIRVQQIWHSQITSMSSFVQNLRKLSVWTCHNLKYLFTSSMVKSLEQLEVLNIKGCKEMQVVILIEELGEKEKTSQTMFPKLDNLELSDLPQLIRFCSNCNSLGEVYEARGLNSSGSQVLAATQSNLMETEVSQLVFPQIHITKWPLLKRMHVEQCVKMKTFASEFLSNENTYGDNHHKRQIQDPMFWISQDSFPCLEQLECIRNDNMKEIWRGQYLGAYFPKLKDIKLLQFQNSSAPSFQFFFQILPSLQKLDVSEASFHEIFQCERLRSEGRPVYVPSQLSELKLSKLNRLMHLWKEESDLKSIFYNLRTLEVLECIKLVNLVPPVVSFENLRTLEISKCHGLEHLVSYSTAKSLEQLERMTITDCDLVEEIVKCLEDNVKDGIVFRQLKSLQLRGLPKLSSFCTRKCDFEFPSLKEVTVIGCPQMKYFSMGKTVTKELQNVQWINDEEKGHWVGDLNSTIEDLFTQKVGYFGFESLKLSESSELIRIWKRNSEELTLPFNKLQSLQVNNCSSLSYLLTPSMVLHLVQLKNLKVKDCAAMEQVIMATRVGEVVESDSVLFPQLKSISLESCSELSRFYVGSKTLKFPMLEKITVNECLKMVRFTSQFSSEQEKETTDRRSEELLVKKEPNIFIEAFFCDEVEFPNLNLLKLSSININQIWNKNHEEISSFKKLQHLEICNCSSMSYLLTPSMVFCLVQLKNLKVKDCAAIEQVIMATRVGEVVESDSILFPQLKSISLESNFELSSFYVGSKTLKFPMLEEITVNECLKMVRFTSQFSSEQEKETTDGRSEELLVKKESNIFVEAFFCDEVEFPNLNLLELSSININQIWNKNHEEISSFKKLQHLEICNCSSMSYLLTPSMVFCLVQLKNLKVKDCAAIEQVIMATRVGEVVEYDSILFPQLKSISLESNFELSSFYVGSKTLKFPMLVEITVKECLKMVRFTSQFSSEQEKETTDGRSEELLVKKEPNIFIEAFFCDEVEFPNLNLLKLFSININQIWNKNHEEISSFKKLQHLEICNCSSLSYLLTPSMVFCLMQLKNLKVKDCAAIEQVIMATRVGEVVESDSILFPQLKSISLKSCPELSSFYVGSKTLKFPMLEKITVKGCLKMVRFTSKFSSEQEKETIDGGSEELLVTKEPNIFIEAFLCDEVEIQIHILKTLTLSSINMKQIWNNPLSSTSLFAQHLTKLKVANCSNLKYLFTFSMVKSFVQLEELGISGCEMMEVVILIEGTVEEEKICQMVFPKLETLILNDLPQLATFCFNCDSLGKISDSGRVNFDTRSQILPATQSTLAETEATKLVFSQLTELMLRLLPKFKSFFPQTHITEWPSLKSLVVIECHGVQIVASEFSSTGMTRGDSQLERESQHLMFWISKVKVPSLEFLVVKLNDNMKIQWGYHPQEYFGKLKVLHLLGVPKQSAFLPPFFFHSLPNLKKLLVKDAFFDEIFQCEEVTSEEKPVCGRTPLRKLRLSKLHELTHLWKEESQLEVDILRKLKTLKVQECSRLKNLVPSTVHFDNLRTLVVSECHGLVNLVRYSTAKSLGRLKRMKVANCEMIEEIVVCSGDAVNDGIVFTELECLQLKGLPRLESFCSGDCNFKFPALEEVIVTECPSMQIFSKGELSTPELDEVKLTGDIDEDMDGDIDEDIEKIIDDILNKDEGVEDDEVEDERCWAGNLNSTVQQLFKEKRARNSEKGNGENNDHDAKEDGN